MSGSVCGYDDAGRCSGPVSCSCTDSDGYCAPAENAPASCFYCQYPSYVSDGASICSASCGPNGKRTLVGVPSVPGCVPTSLKTVQAPCNVFPCLREQVGACAEVICGSELGKHTFVTGLGEMIRTLGSAEASQFDREVSNLFSRFNMVDAGPVNFKRKSKQCRRVFFFSWSNVCNDVTTRIESKPGAGAIVTGAMQIVFGSGAHGNSRRANLARILENGRIDTSRCGVLGLDGKSRVVMNVTPSQPAVLRVQNMRIELMNETFWRDFDVDIPVIGLVITMSLGRCVMEQDCCFIEDVHVEFEFGSPVPHVGRGASGFLGQLQSLGSTVLGKPNQSDSIFYGIGTTIGPQVAAALKSTINGIRPASRGFDARALASFKYEPCNCQESVETTNCYARCASRHPNYRDPTQQEAYNRCVSHECERVDCVIASLQNSYSQQNSTAMRQVPAKQCWFDPTISYIPIPTRSNTDSPALRRQGTSANANVILYPGNARGRNCDAVIRGNGMTNTGTNPRRQSEIYTQVQGGATSCTPNQVYQDVQALRRAGANVYLDSYCSGMALVARDASGKITDILTGKYDYDTRDRCNFEFDDPAQQKRFETLKAQHCPAHVDQSQCDVDMIQAVINR